MQLLMGFCQKNYIPTMVSVSLLGEGLDSSTFWGNHDCQFDLDCILDLVDGRRRTRAWRYTARSASCAV